MVKKPILWLNSNGEKSVLWLNSKGDEVSPVVMHVQVQCILQYMFFVS